MRRFALVSLLAAILLPLAGAVAFASATERRPTAVAPDHPADHRMAEGVAEWLDAGVAGGDFSTGSANFDQEWSFGTWQMAALGFAQHAAAHPEDRDVSITRMERAVDRILADEGRAFDTSRWGEDPLDALDGPNGHMAWLGYTNLVLSAHRALVPDSRFAPLNDRLTAALAHRIDADPIGIPETYRGERYPVDVSAGVASIGLYDRVTGADHAALLARFRTNLAERWIVDGVLIQAVRADGTARDAPRGSGTFLAAWFLSWWDGELAGTLYRGGRAALGQDLGFAYAMREYPAGHAGNGDIDSGPIVAGLGVSSTGFAIGAARAAGDHDTAEGLIRLATLVGRPLDTDGARHWQTGAQLGGAPLADAILFAMLTTPAR